MKDAKASLPLSLDEALKAAFELVEVGVWGWDEIAQTKIWPAETKAIFGLPPETAMTRELFVSMLHPDDVPRYHAAWAEAMRPDGQRLYELTYRIRRASDGAQRWINSRARVEFSGDRPVKVLGALRDITVKQELIEDLRRDIAERERAETALRESETALKLERSRLRLAADAAGLTFIDADFVADRLVVSDNYRSVMGYAPATPPDGGAIDAGVRSLVEHVAAPDRAGLVAALLALRDTGAMPKTEFRLRGDDGTERSFECVGRGEFDAKGRPVRAFVTKLDVTARVEAARALAEARRKADEILGSIADCFYALDAHGRFVYFNARAEETLERRREEVIGRALTDVFPQTRGHAILENYQRVMRERRPISFQAISPSLQRWVDFTVYPTPEGGVSVCFRDISEQKAIEDQLVAAKSEADRANRAKSKFLASASHDLRQPVQSLVLLLSLIERQVAATPRAIETTRLMKQALGGLNGLLTSILDISRLDAGVVEPAPETVDLSLLLWRLVGEYMAKAEDKGLELRFAPQNLHVRADPTLLERALRNLMENALRYTEKGVVLVGLRRRGGEARIDVIDTGPGIPEKRQGEIFDEFTQLNNPGRDLAQGLGLGLAIVARLAGIMGARIELASNVGRGSRFSLSLPRVAPQPIDCADIADFCEPGGRLLVVEDNQVLRHGIEALARQWGYEVVAVENGEAALARDDLRFDALISDYRLGAGRNGVETAKEIEARLGRRLPTLILTGDTAKERIAEISASGRELLHKPVNAEQLRRTLARLVSQAAVAPA